MENLNSPGVVPYESAAPIARRNILEEFIYFFQELFVYFYTLILSLPIFVKVLKHTLTTKPEKSIKGQLALVTGGGNGLGKAIAIRLAKQKVNVAIADVDTAAAVRVAEDCRSFGVKAQAFTCNVGSFAEIKQLSRDIEEQIGPVDILINNAGLMPVISFQEGKPEDIQRILDINVTSHIWVRIGSNWVLLSGTVGVMWFWSDYVVEKWLIIGGLCEICGLFVEEYSVLYPSMDKTSKNKQINKIWP